MKNKKILLSMITSSILISSSLNANEINTNMVINEFKANIAEDEHAKQYIELRGKPNTIIKDTYLVVIDGDEDQEGHVDYAYNLNGITIGSNGLIIIKNKNEYNNALNKNTTVLNDPLIKTYGKNNTNKDYKDGILEHDAVTYALIKSSTPIKKGDDLDKNNNGKLNLPTNAKVLDSVGNLDGGDGFVYSNVILSQSASDPDAASRFYDDMRRNNLSAWANGDMYEDENKEKDELSSEVLYDTLKASFNLPPKAKLTPGQQNFKKAPFVLINEVVNSEDKYIELLSNSAQSFKDIYLLIISKDSNKISQSIDLSNITAKESGITIIQDNQSHIKTGKVISSSKQDLSVLNSDKNAVILVYSPKETINKGSIWNKNNTDIVILDNISWGNSKYSDVAIKDNAKAAIRYKDNVISSLNAWNFEEKYKTPANTNIAKTAQILVKPTAETKRTIHESADADDIAFWIHPTNSAKSFIIGTQKKAGYSIYDTNGKTLADVDPGDIRFNNVDVIYNFNFKGKKIDLAIFTDRITNKFAIYKITENSPYLVDMTDKNSKELFQSKKSDTAYGQAVYKSIKYPGKTYAYATRNKHSLLAKFELKVKGDKIGWDKISTITLEGSKKKNKHAEGMVVDQEYGKLYIAQEDVGIYTMDAEINKDITLSKKDFLIQEGEHDLVEDLEGVTLYYKDNGKGYFMVSSQGNFTYGVFNRTDVKTKNKFVNTFAIVDNMNGIDGSQETDSIDVTNIALNSTFPYGAFIVQDGMDTTPNPKNTKTNFKFVRWDNIAKKLGDTNFTSNYNPRNPQNRR